MVLLTHSSVKPASISVAVWTECLLSVHKAARALSFLTIHAKEQLDCFMLYVVYSTFATRVTQTQAAFEHELRTDADLAN